MKYTDDVVRIGGRCKNEEVRKKRLENKTKFSNRTYRGIIKDLDIRGENMKTLPSLIDFRRKVDVSMVIRSYNELYNKIIEDFFIIVNKSIPINFRINLKGYADKKICRDIYIFWNNIDRKSNPREIILSLLDKLNFGNIIFDYLYKIIYNGFKGYDEDNFELLKYLNKNNIEFNNNNINENNFQEEEEEEDDEEELAQNLDRLDMDYYLRELYEKENEIKNNEIVEEYADENDNDLKKLLPLNNEKFKYLLNCKVNFFRLGPKIIKQFIDYMRHELLKEESNHEYNLAEFSKLLEKKNQISLINDAEEIKKYKIVAMTTTGCAKYSTILEQRNFEIIIIEEAAEVLESHVISLLTKNTKRLILIGDHKQLKPKTYNYELGTKYNLNVSLFERLINNKIPFSSLKYQRRMKSIFADFVRIIYGEEDYVDYEDIDNKEKVKGIMNDIYFINHNRHETENTWLKSKQNDYEAKYISKLCN